MVVWGKPVPRPKIRICCLARPSSDFILYHKKLKGVCVKLQPTLTITSTNSCVLLSLWVRDDREM